MVGTLLLRSRHNGLTFNYKNPRILIVFKSPNSLLDYFDTVNKLIEKKTEGSITTKLLKNARTIIRRYGTLVRRTDAAIRQCSELVTWISVLAKGGGQKKRFQYCVNPNCSQKFLYLRAIQGHSGSTINPALQNNALLPESFTEYIYHVGNGKELRSIVNHGLIPGAVSLKTSRQAVFFTVVSPTDNQVAWGKPHATCRKQESRHTKILGNTFRIQYVGAI